jgi:hypothetical protein
MAVTATTFKAAFPEFAVDSDVDALIVEKLAEAEGMVDRALFQLAKNADSAVSYCAAHHLAISPAGINARLSKGDGKTLYWETYKRLMRTGAMLKGRVA